ncbi:MAG: hypothetical protein COA99_09500, partial [Moraxellaceae bacterium]
MSENKRVTLKIQTAICIIISAIGLFAFNWMNYSANDNIHQQLSRLKNVDYMVLVGIHSLQMKQAEIDRAYERSLLESDVNSLNKGRNLVIEAKNKISELTHILPDANVSLGGIETSLINYVNALDEYAKDYIEGKLDERVVFSMQEEVNKKRNVYEQELGLFTEKIADNYKESIRQIQDQGFSAFKMEAAIGVVLVSFICVITVVLVGSHLKNLIRATEVTHAVKKGNLEIEITKPKDSETAALMDGLEAMRDSLKEKRSLDELKSNNQHRLSRLNDAMRGDLTLRQLSQQVLSSMAAEFDILVGRLFCIDGEVLEYVAGYAFSEDGEKKNSYILGESLVGQCALDKKLICISDVPESYISVSSSTGETIARNLIIFPLIHNQQLTGVIELAALSEFDQEMRSYILDGSEGVAIAVNAAKSREKLSDMLGQTQAQAQAMENQKEELRVTNEELEGQARELRSSEENMQAQQEELRVMNEELEERTRMLDHQKQEILKKNVALEKSKEVMLQKTDQLEMSGQYKSEFLSTMSHELRTPLNSILILSQGLMNNNKKTLTDKEVEHAKVIHSSGEDLLSLINDILDLSKVEEGKFELVVDEVSPEELMSIIEQQFSFEAEKKGIELKLHLVDVPEFVYLDKHRLNQILRNFLSNSFKFTEKGCVELSMQMEDSVFQPDRKSLRDGEYFVIKVKDTGIGIPLDKQQSIFEAFQQADGTTSRQYGGTGLGLTISKELSNIMGGEIKVHSDGEGKGASFILFLPIRHDGSNELEKNDGGLVDRIVQQDISSKEPLDAPHVISSTFVDERSVLIVEDDLEFAKILGELAEGFGLNPWIENNGEDALLLLKDKLPGSIILDLGLPGIGGLEVLEILKNNDVTKDIPVHVISGKEESASVLAMGAVDLLNKPADKNSIEGLFQKIKHETLDTAKRLLIIEDDPVQQQALHDLFSVNHMYFDVVDSGAKAEHLLRENDYDCIVMDLRLPDSSGLDILRRLRSLDKNNHVPAIIYTAMDVSREMEAELRKVADRIILKSGNAMDRLLSETSLFLNWVDTQRIDGRDIRD